MQTVLVAIDSSATVNPEIDKNIESRLGRRCHVMTGVWVVQTEKAMAEAYDLVAAHIMPGDSFMVTRIDDTEPWLAHNVPTMRKCFP